jgi:lysophospholipase L1-like esterase
MQSSVWAFAGRAVVLVGIAALLAGSSVARAQGVALPQRWILAGDSIQTQTFPNAEFGLVGGDARDVTAAIIQQDTGVLIQNVSVPGIALAEPGGLKDQRAMIQYLANNIFLARGLILTIGVNDARRNVDVNVYQREYGDLVRFARGLGLQVVCVLPLNELDERADVNVSRRFAFQLATLFACEGAGVGQNVFNPAAVGIFPDLQDPAKRRLFSTDVLNGGPDSIHLSSAGHRVFADRLIDFMVQRGFWRRR